MTVEQEIFDVIVIGSGNAGFAAACSAAQSGASRVLLLDRCPAGWVGGNTTFTAGAYRTAHNGLEDLLPLVRNVDDSLAKLINLPAYSEPDFAADLDRVTDGRSDPMLGRMLVSKSRQTTDWLSRDCEIAFDLAFHRQAYEIDGMWKFWGGLSLAVRNGGKGLISDWMSCAERLGIETRFDQEVFDFILEDARVAGVVTRSTVNSQSQVTIKCKGGLVLAAGGFEANPALRSRYLGKGWERAYVRGTPYNTGTILQAAIAKLDAATMGDWEGCHSTCWDWNAPKDAGDQQLTNQFTKSGEILKQPEGIAFQLWDATTSDWLRKEEYGPDVVERITADSIEELADTLASKGLQDPKELIEQFNDYNKAVSKFRAENPELRFDPSRKDGLSTRSSKAGLELDKTNWALPLVKAPFLAVKVTCGITFTFGGLKIDPQTAAVISRTTHKPIPGLFCAGEMVGGLFYGNYPGGSGLTSGAVFGRLAGASASACRNTHNFSF